MAKQADLLSVEEARRRILAVFHRLEVERVPLNAAHERVLAQAVTVPFDLPPFANSSMDGFALAASTSETASTERPVRLRVGSHIAAGQGSVGPVERGECARIMTGAPLPPGADAVAPFEDVLEQDGHIIITRPVPAGACTRPAGQDIRSGQEVLSAGTVLQAPQIGLLAALGQDTLPVIRRPIVAVLSTGNELVAPGTALQPGQIYNSNTPMLEAAIAEAGAVSRLLPTAIDDPEAIERAIAAAGDADCLLTTGGASVGDYDYVKAVVGQGGQLDFWRVRLRPGKPLLFGSVDGRPVVGLPGNPTSAMVTFEQFVRPAIKTMLGAPSRRSEVEVVVDERIENRGGRRTYARVKLSVQGGQFHAALAGGQDSAMLVPLAMADGLLDIAEDRAEVLPGERGRVQVWRLPPSA